MLSKLFRKKSASPSEPKGSESPTVEPPGVGDDPQHDPYDEDLIEGATINPGASTPSDELGSGGGTEPGPRVKEKASKGKLGRKKPAYATAAEVENPRVLIAEAIGGQAMTLAKTNTALKIALLCVSGTALIMSIAAAVGFSEETEYRYFFFSSDGTVLEREPLSEPSLTLNSVRDFYAESLSHLFSFHYRNFADHYQRLAPDIMTDVAMREFAQELDRIGLIDSMRDRREVAEAVILQTPVLVASGEDPKTGRYTWELAVPFNLRLEAGRVKRGEEDVRKMGGTARVQIIRVEPSEHPRQILINRITIRDTTNE